MGVVDALLVLDESMIRERAVEGGVRDGVVTTDKGTDGEA